MKVDDMTEDEFKITVMAFLPWIQFTTYDQRGVHVVYSDYFVSGNYGPLGSFMYVLEKSGNVRLGFTESFLEYNSTQLVDILKRLNRNGEFVCIYRGEMTLKIRERLRYLRRFKITREKKCRRWLPLTL